MSQLPDPRAALEALRVQIEKALDRLEKESYGVDVREKFKTDRMVIAVVVDHSTAMHELLFLRSAILKALASSDPPAVRQSTEKKEIMREGAHIMEPIDSLTASSHESQSQQVQHSPLPWTAIGCNVEAASGLVCAVGTGLTLRDAKEDAEFIARACNVHNDLLAALKEIVDWSDCLCDDHASSDCCAARPSSEFHCAGCVAARAIAKAEGKTMTSPDPTAVPRHPPDYCAACAVYGDGTRIFPMAQHTCTSVLRHPPERPTK